MSTISFHFRYMGMRHSWANVGTINWWVAVLAAPGLYTYLTVTSSAFTCNPSIYIPIERCHCSYDSSDVHKISLS